MVSNWIGWHGEKLLDSTEEITDKIKETNEEAKNIIRDLPLNARDNAADAWAQGSGFAMVAFRTVCSQITVVSSRVGEFEKSEFGILSQAEDKVNSVVEANILAILDRSKDVTGSKKTGIE